MKTKWILPTVMALTLVVAAMLVTGCKESGQTDQAKQYTCTHHPEVMQDKPGTCPKCGMKLVEKR